VGERNVPKLTSLALACTERGLMPDPLVRLGIRRLLDARLEDIGADDAEATAAHVESFMASMRQAPVALVPEKANEQHYEVPAEFFAAVLGPRRKYSSGYWPEGVNSLAEAEEAALADTASHAGLADGQRILELGCGWGSLTLWMAEHLPRSRITAVSNSHSQRAFITAEAHRRGLRNIEVVTCDINEFETAERFDRVVSVEMFEHLRNWPEIFRRVAGWLKPGGRFFMHVFTHRSTPYLFDVRDETDWMSRHFFSGGMMPSSDLALRCQEHLALQAQWRWDGTHYARTAEAWLDNLDARRYEVWPLLEETYGAKNAGLWWHRWRLFFLSCAELFGFDHGQEWGVSHYLFAPR
jgi:cyclopropane-fatty-acyl-phospholipid synthase